MLPPVDAHLLGLVHGGDQQPELDRQQLDVQQVDLDITCDDDALVQDTFENVGQIGRGTLLAVWGPPEGAPIRPASESGTFISPCL